MSLDHLVLHDGDRVRFPHATVVSADGRTWLQAPQWTYDREAWPTPPSDEWAVWVDGVDLGRLAERDALPGRVRGVASLSGTWSSGRVTVDGQGAPEPWASRSGWTIPPCPPPPGGWPRAEPRVLDEVHRRADLPCVVHRRLCHPEPDREVLVLTVTDPAAVEAAVAPWLGRYVCVVPSRFTGEDLESARADLESRMRQWRLTTVGLRSNDEGQTVAHADAERALPELAAWARTQPEGLLAVDAWLVPDRSPAAR